MQNTWMAKKEEITEQDRDWYIVDAEGKPLGRIASKVATVLQGKHKPTYTPHVDTGDFVVVVNATDVKLTGNKAEQKMYYSHSDYLGNLKQKSYGELLEEDSLIPIKEAVRRMMPKNNLADEMLKKFKPYKGEDHPHAAKDFKELDI
ncbi:MAG: 50S ribosomal protein L13 [Candidatus Bipolaricaulota bacterium]|nr:50S ribosomal protein L13 [Candidatus Bipolaricaulota bacterium]MBS3791169.1 50S ribosomal protein L13 [Candidatus Bipolaricaulota bacterium]